MKFRTPIRVVLFLVAFALVCTSVAPDATAATATTATHHRQTLRERFHGWQCATYVRLITPILLRGNAWTWWQKATGQYTKGNQPKIGSVIVFKRTKVMPLGHVAVVRRVVNDREVWVEHANWGMGRNRGKVSVGDRVIDVSKNNDWTDVRVWSAAMNDFGRANATYGFIYSPDYDQRTGIQWNQADSNVEDQPQPEMSGDNS